MKVISQPSRIYSGLGRKKNGRRLIPTPAKRESRTIFGAWNLKKEIFYWKQSHTGNSTSNIAFYEQLKKNNRNKSIIIIEDNVSYHKSKKVRNWLEKNQDFKIFYLPTYSPEYNPVEKIWKWLKKNIYGEKAVDGGIQEIIKCLRVICWHWRENRLFNPLKIKKGIWNDLL